MAENLGMDIHVTAKGARQVAVDLDAVTRAAEKAEQAAIKNTKGWQQQAEAFHKNEEAIKKNAEAQKKVAEEAEKMRKSMGDLLAQIDPMERKLQELDKLEKELAKAYKSGAIEADKYKESLKKINKERDAAVSGNKSYAQSIQEIAGALGLAAVAAKGFNFIQDVTQTAARYEQLGVLMNTLGATAGYSAVELENYEKALQKTGISMSQSRDVIQSMISANMDLAQATDLARLAQDAATIGGISSSDALQRLIHGIQTAQTDVLRGVGIVVNFEQAYSKLAATLGKTTATLTETEKQQARINAVMEQAPALAGAYINSMDTAAKKAGSMERHILNLKTAMGEVFQPVYAASIDAQSAAIESASKNAKALSLALAGVVAGVTVLTAGIATATVGVTAFNAALNLIRGHPVVLALSVMASLATAGYLAWSDSARGANEYKGSLDILNGSIEEVTESLRKMTRAQQESINNAIISKVNEAHEQIKALSDSIMNTMAPETLMMGFSLTYDEVEVATLLKDIVDTGRSTDELRAKLEQLKEQDVISPEQYAQIVDTAARMDTLNQTIDEAAQQQQKLQAAMEATGSSARDAADGVATLDQAMADALKAGESYAKSLSERALVAGLSTETAMLKAREAAGLVKFASEEAREAALKDAKAIDDANEARKNATKAASAYSSALKAEEQAYKDLIKSAMPYEAAVADLVKHTATLDKALAKGKITNEQYAATIKNLGDSYKKAVIATVPHLSAIDAEVKTTESAVRSMRQRIDTFGMTATAIARTALAETNARIGTLEVIKATQAATGASKQYIEQIDLEIDALKRLQIQQEHLVGLTATNEQNEARVKAAEDLAAEVKRTHDEIEKSLTDALLRGFESGEGFGRNFINTLKNMFATLVLRPIIQPIASSAAGAVTGALGLGGGSGGLMQGAGLLSNIQSIGSAISGSITGTLAAGVGKLGATFGSEALKNFAFGLSGVQGPVLPGAANAVGLGSMVGAAVPWLAGGAALYSIASSFMNKGETRTGGGFVYNPETGRTNYAGGPSGGTGGADSAVGELFKSVGTTITSVLKAAGVDARLNNFQGAFESSGKGRGGVFSGGDLVLPDGTVVSFGGSRKGDGFGGKSGSPDEMLQNLQKDVVFSTLEAWKAAASFLPTVIGDALSEVDIRSLGYEQAEALAAEISAVVESVTAVSEALTELPFLKLTDLSFDLTYSLLEAAGGIENLSGSLDSFYQNFYSEAEQSAFATEQFLGAMASLGVQVPTTASGFRDLVNSIQVTDQESANLKAQLLGLSGAAATFYQSIESAMQSQIQAQTSSIQAHYNDLKSKARDHYNSQVKMINDSYKRQTDAVRKSISAASEKIRELNAVSRALESGLASLLGSNATTAASIREQSLGLIDTALAGARKGQSVAGFEGLDKAVADVAKINAAEFSSLFEFEREQQETAQKLAELNDYTSAQIDTQELIHESLTKQLETLESWRDRQLSYAEYSLNATLDRYDRMAEREIENAAKAHEEVMEQMLKDNQTLLEGMGADAKHTNQLVSAMNSGANNIIQAVRSIRIDVPAPVVVVQGGQQSAAGRSSLPHFANGGLFIAGERGPEVVDIGAARIHNASKTEKMLSNEELEKKVDKLTEITERYLPIIASSTQGTESIQRAWDWDGMPEPRDVEIRDVV